MRRPGNACATRDLLPAVKKAMERFASSLQSGLECVPREVTAGDRRGSSDMASHRVDWGRPMGAGEGGGGRGRGREEAAGDPMRKKRRTETEEEEWAKAMKHTAEMDRRQQKAPKAGQLGDLDKFMASIDHQIADGMRHSASRGQDRVDLDADEAVGGTAKQGPQYTRCTVISQPGIEGRTGRVVDWDDAKGEYTLLLDATDQEHRTFKSRKLVPWGGGYEYEDNFVKLARGKVQQLVEGVAVVGLKSQAHLNGRVGRVLGFDRAAARYRVSLPGEVEVAVKCDNLVFPNGTRVELVGLQNAKDHNGKWGTITEYSEEDGRYTVCVSDDLSLRPRLANCRA